jgi:predicted phage tail protein
MTSAVLTEVRFNGILAKKYGRSHMVLLDRKTPAEAMKWLQSQFPEARSFFATAHQRGMAFAVFRGRGKHRENIGKDQLKEPAGGMITFMPVIQGAKSGGVFNVILGAVLIAASFIPFLAPIAPYLMSAGIAMIAGGVVQMLSPQPKLTKSADSAGNQASYVFSGAVNTSAEGNAVPVCYGRMRIGSAVISAGIEANDYSPAVVGMGVGTPGGNLKKTPYDLPI